MTVPGNDHLKMGYVIMLKIGVLVLIRYVCEPEMADLQSRSAGDR